MPQREHFLRRRLVRSEYHPRRASLEERRRQAEAAIRLAADVLPDVDVLAAYLVGQGHSATYALMASSQMRARAGRGCSVTLAVIRQLEDEAAL